MLDDGPVCSLLCCPAPARNVNQQSPSNKSLSNIQLDMDTDTLWPLCVHPEGDYADWLQSPNTEISATWAYTRRHGDHQDRREDVHTHMFVLDTLHVIILLLRTLRVKVKSVVCLYSCLYILSSQQCRAAPTPAPVLGGSRDIFITTIGETKNVTRLVPTTFYIHIAGPGWVQGTD